MFNAKELYPTQRYLKFTKLQLVKEKAGYYHIPEKITSPEAAYHTILEVLELDKEPQEVLVLISLDVKHKVIGVDKISVGTLNASIVHPREVFKKALANNAALIMLAHNHPSGDSKPSPEDIQVTDRIKQAGDILGVELLDHIIIGDETFVSLKEMGYVA